MGKSVPKPIIHFEYLAENRIRNLYRQIHRGWFRRIPLQVSLSLLQLGQMTLSTPTGSEPDLTDQLRTVLASREKHHPEKIGAVDEPRMYIKGVLPMFTHILPQGFGVKATDEPAFIYYGGATDSTIFGLAGPVANLVGNHPAGDSMGNISSSLPNLSQVLARHYHVQSRFLAAGRTRRKRVRFDEEEALACMGYMEIWNGTIVQRCNCATMHFLQR